eukprot:CAMPEP_0179424818 /NCGR_PEP_ID=MMETSP0799-20121207/11816_1 /TAXON_ID=46947 /ORGANISM="Geminigera cryophila, Strain CCMP2564" /LENGTH=232 /DNA_ID=CAMNT_0021199345 /DNA_START=827 /DNA_END=1525 /DNA_ORIENTATION=+
MCDRDTTANYIPNGFWRWTFGKAPDVGGRENQISDDSSCEGSSHILKSSERPHLFNWQGTVRRNRAKMIAVVQKYFTTSTSTDARYFLSIINRSFDGPGKSFQDAVQNSVFTLCPCGNNAETHRLWEALLAGSIPIQEDCANDDQSNESQKHFILFLKRVLPHIIFIQDWNSLKFVLDQYDTTDETGKTNVSLDEKQRSMYSSFLKFMVQIGMESGDVITGAQSKVSWLKKL